MNSPAVPSCFLRVPGVQSGGGGVCASRRDRGLRQAVGRGSGVCRRDDQLIADAKQVGVGDVVRGHNRLDSDIELLGDGEEVVACLDGIKCLVQRTDICGGEAWDAKHGADWDDMGIGNRVAVEGDQFGQCHLVLFGDGGQGLAGADSVRSSDAGQGGVGGAPASCGLIGGGACARNQQDLTDGETVFVSQRVEGENLVQGRVEAERDGQERVALLDGVLERL